jgi:hypothetical protein
MFDEIGQLSISSRFPAAEAPMELSESILAGLSFDFVYGVNINF